MPNDAPDDAITAINALTAINTLSEDAFVERFGFLFEHSPWLVKAAAAARPFAGVEDLYGALMTVLYDSDDRAQRDLLKAHPKLADKAAIAAGLTKESAAEQASAGLDRLTPDEYARFHELNAAYDQKFGFPFIICVRLAGGKAGILESMQARLANPPGLEQMAALDEVAKIVRLRLQDEVSK